MNTRNYLVRIFAAFSLTLIFAPGRLDAQVTTFNDATNDIAAGISTAGGTLDIVKMEVVDTATDVIFTMTVNGNINPTSGGVDWGNFMVGIANQKVPGTVAVNGNGWNRPINLNAGITNGVTNGMTHWIGSWVNGGGGSGGGQLWTYGTTNWSQSSALTSFTTSPGAQSTLTYTVSKESLGVTNGDTIIFDAYSSGGGGGDSAVDALSNPNNSITDWPGPYTSQAPTLTRAYTLNNTALNTTQNITFFVDMSAQIAAGNFNGSLDAVSVEYGSGFASFAPLTAQGGGIYSGVASVSAPANTPVSYRFAIEPADPQAPIVPETVSRNFLMPETATVLPTVYFNNIQAYRDVTFTVNMSVQETLGTFDPASQTVEVRGPFNNWAGTALAAQGSGIYSATVRVGGTPDAAVDYKFYTAGPGAAGYESLSGNRSFTLAINPGGAPTPALVLPTVFFSNQDVVPAFTPVTFSVNMNRQITLGNFNASTGVVEVRGTFNGWAAGTALADGDSDGIYTRTINVVGSPGATVDYKFWASAPLEWETVPNRSFILGPTGVTQVLTPTPYFNNDSGQTREVTFSVDMSVQQALGLFNPDTGVVQLRGLGGFGEAQAQNLTREGTTLVYSGTFAVPGDEGTAFAYKFYSAGINYFIETDPSNTGYEIISQTDGFVNRQLTLGANGVAQPAPLVYFSNQLLGVLGTTTSPLPNSSFVAFSSTQGTPSFPQTVSVSGRGLTTDIVANAPSGFEVSSDGVAYASTASIPAVSGVVSSAALYVRVAASAVQGSVAGRVTLQSDGSQTTSISVSGTVAAPANFYGSWLTNYPSLTGASTNGTADPDGDGFNNNVEFAFDGNPTAGTPALMTVTRSGANAVFNWIQRTNGVAYEVQRSSGLTNGWTPAAGLTISNSTNQGGVLLAPDYVRREFVVPASGKDFYRVQSAITNN